MSAYDDVYHAGDAASSSNNSPWRRQWRSSQHQAMMVGAGIGVVESMDGRWEVTWISWAELCLKDSNF